MVTNDYIAYFKDLCAKHSLLQNSDVSGSRVFAVISQEQAVGDFRSGVDIDGWLFRLVVPQWTLVETGDGRVLKDWLGGFVLAKRFSAREELDDVRVALLSEVDAVGESFAARMIRDCEAGHPLFGYSIRSPYPLQFKALPKTGITEGYVGRFFTFRFQNATKLCDTSAFLDAL